MQEVKLATIDELIDVVMRAALGDYGAQAIWAQNLSFFRRMMGEDDYWKVTMCIREIFLEGIDLV